MENLTVKIFKNSPTVYSQRRRLAKNNSDVSRKKLTGKEILISANNGPNTADIGFTLCKRPRDISITVPFKHERGKKLKLYQSFDVGKLVPEEQLTEVNVRTEDISAEVALQPRREQ